MLPTLWPGDVLTVQSILPEQVEPGEIVLYMRQDRFFIHRIVSRDVTRDKALLRLARKALERHGVRVCRPEAWSAVLIG